MAHHGCRNQIAILSFFINKSLLLKEYLAGFLFTVEGASGDKGRSRPGKEPMKHSREENNSGYKHDSENRTGVRGI